MRLLSFLSDIERALFAESAASKGGAWESQRMVNFHHSLARLTLHTRSSREAESTGGTIFLQGFTVADGSLCLKASLSWKGSDALKVISVYSTPRLNWTEEASRIAAAWRQGPPAEVTTSDERESDLRPLAAAAG